MDPVVVETETIVEEGEHVVEEDEDIDCVTIDDVSI